jgi:putative ABC transport system substrate-binding protein
MGGVLRRRFLIATGALLAAPLVAEAQPARSYRVGFLGLASASDYAQYVNAFLLGLRELGYVEGRNLVIEYRWADGREERLPELAIQLVRLNPDVLVSHAIGVSAAQQATSTIPIVMGVSSDPVGFGLIKSLAKPGGNTTGVTSQMIDLSSKRLELLREAVPKLKDVAVLSNLALPGPAQRLGGDGVCCPKARRSRAIVRDQRGRGRTRIGICRNRARAAERAHRPA